MLVLVPLMGFDGEVVYSDEIIQLPLVLGQGSRTSRVLLDILVADIPSAYNMILGRSGLNTLQVVPSTYHMVVKFPTANGVGKVRGDLRVARECYMESIGAVRGTEALQEKNGEILSRGETSSQQKEEEKDQARAPPPAVNFLLEGPEDLKIAKLVDRLEEVLLREDRPD